MRNRYIVSVIMAISLWVSPGVASACLPSSIEGLKGIMSQSHFKCMDGHIPEEAMEYLRAGEQHYKDGNILSADQHIRYGLWVATKALGTSNPEIVRLLNAIGNLYLAKGNFKKSEQYLYTAIDSAQKLGANGVGGVGGRSIDMKSLVGDLGVLYKRQNLPTGKAESLFNSAMKSLDIDPKKSFDFDLDSALEYVKKQANQLGR
ncbi:MAG: hypothetical protein MK137_03760 [Rickettsiales bacterium]|nr:hypothetical protein [Rickettsiales bacterium]